MKEKELQLVNFEQAKRLKKINFNFVNDVFYSKNGTLLCYKWEFGSYEKKYIEEHFVYPAPTVALALKWFRDEIKICNCISREVSCYDSIKYVGKFKDLYLTDDTFDTYEAAESALLDELLTLIETQ